MRGVPLTVIILFIMTTVVLSGCGSHVGHMVRKGETLYSISFRYGQDYKEVARWNNIKPPYLISPGQNLRITSPPAGEELAAISSAEKKKPVVMDKSVGSMTVNKLPVKKPVETHQKNTIIVTTKPPPPEYPKKVVWRWPVWGKVIQTFSDKQPGRKGIDIRAASGSIIKAAASGRVVYAGEGLASYGKLIIIKHNEQFLSAYAHNRKLLVKEGQNIKAGMVIAEMGNSGTNTVKLHFEVRRKGKPVNPLWYLPKR